ncbi:MAG TPA: pectin acetylesterase-family hydrolase [Polyangiaceae bacterium]|nr:pectin acetylesterase-family hydrolase [Polyangiaceae bacterium]
MKNFPLISRGLGLVASFVVVAACGSSSSGPSNTGTPKGPPITGLPAMTWTWVPIEGTQCRDGSGTGIGVNTNPNSKNLMIFLEGGGACFNAATCIANASAFGMNDFSSRFGGSSGPVGVFNRADTSNAVADWNFVYVPFCTGDVHAGNAPNTMVPGVTGPQQFVGYTNITKDLARIAPTFPGLDKVLLTGISAGGFGAASNYVQTAEAFDPVPVYDLDDSGPPMEDPYAPKCLQQQWAQLWGLDKTVLAECGADCPDPTNFTLDATLHVVRKYPKIPFGLVEDTDDSVITLFYAYGSNNCAPVVFPTPLSGSDFTAGLLDERMKTAAYPNVGGFIFTGTDHTTLSMSTYDTRTAGGDGDDAGTPTATKLTDWVAALVNTGTVTNVGP